ncbi:hypothetical protein LTR17_004801 [Elasticomyces elasticus]|nr:hypothetical protein LTR17_004801 [Elasticomyces elasticus]
MPQSRLLDQLCAVSASSAYADLPLDPKRNRIRLLDILLSPAKQADIQDPSHVRCQLRCVDVESAPEFSALSYTWGHGADRAYISVNGAITSVTINLESLLRHLQRSYHVVTVWADALCINQADDVEKGQQVQRMHAIYSNARRTVAWLGPEGDGSGMAMKVLQSTGQQALEHGILIHEALALSAGLKSQDPAIQGLRSMVEAVGWVYPFKAVQKLCDRPYWSRLWVLQEYALAQSISIQCGSSTLSGDQFNAAYLFLPLLQHHLLETVAEDGDCQVPVQAGADYEVDTDEDGRPLPRVWHMMNNSGHSRVGYLIRTRRLHDSWQKKSDMTPQKRLCALLELTNSERTIKSGAFALGASNAKDRIFGLLGMLGEDAVLGFTIDYHTSDEEKYMAATRWLLFCGQLSLLSYAHIHPNALMPSWSPVWGNQLRAPTVERVFFRPSGTQEGHALPIAANIIRLRGVLLDIVIRCGGFWQPEDYDRGFSSAEAGRFLEEVEAMVTDQSGVPPVLLGMSMEQWQEGAWRIPIADQCRSGIDVEIGDVVSIISGAEAPLLLRPESQGSAYKIVGESYVYGVMDGEALTKDTVFTYIDIC